MRLLIPQANKWMDYFWLPLIGVIVMIGMNQSKAGTPEDSLYEVPTPAKNEVPIAYGPYCGLRCVYAAICYEGGEVEFSSLLKPEYLGNSDGSSLEELDRAVKDLGFDALPIERITEDTLAEIKHPLILHVKSDFNSKFYNHYIVCLRSVRGGIRVFDTPNSLETRTVEELLTQTDGVGLFVAKDHVLAGEFSLSNFSRMAFTGLATFLGCLGAGLYFSKAANRTPNGSKAFLSRSIRQAVGLSASAILVALTVNTVGQGGLLGPNRNEIAVETDVPADIINRSQLENLIKTSDIALIDARYKGDYDLGHIPGAINIPVDMEDGTRRELLKEIPLEKPVVIYCQSQSCPYADRVTAGLRADGHRHLMIFRGGWMEWSTTQPVQAN